MWHVATLTLFNTFDVPYNGHHIHCANLGRTIDEYHSVRDIKNFVAWIDVWIALKEILVKFNKSRILAKAIRHVCVCIDVSALNQKSAHGYLCMPACLLNNKRPTEYDI